MCLVVYCFFNQPPPHYYSTAKQPDQAEQAVPCSTVQIFTCSYSKHFMWKINLNNKYEIECQEVFFHLATTFCGRKATTLWMVSINFSYNFHLRQSNPISFTQKYFKSVQFSRKYLKNLPQEILVRNLISSSMQYPKAIPTRKTKTRKFCDPVIGLNMQYFSNDNHHFMYYIVSICNRYDSSQISITDRFILESRLGLKLLDRYGEENSYSSEQEDSDPDTSYAGSEKSHLEVEEDPKKLEICVEDISDIHYPRKLCFDVLETTNNVLCKSNIPLL